MRRPSLTDTNFLAHIFGPKRHPQPSGIRKTHLSGVKGGRTKLRLAAFNRMSPVNQELLRRAGMREDYLKGNASLSEAKRALRPQAVSLGVAKPIRVKGTGGKIYTPLDAQVAAHLKRTIRDAGRPLNSYTVDMNVPLIPAGDLPDILTWDYGQLKYAGRPGSEYEYTVNGKRHNPLWYH